MGRRTPMAILPPYAAPLAFAELFLLDAFFSKSFTLSLRDRAVLDVVWVCRDGVMNAKGTARVEIILLLAC